VSELLFDFSRERLYVTGCAHALGPLCQTLQELACKGLLASPVKSLHGLGYRYNRSAEPGGDFITLVAPLMRSLLEKRNNPSALVVHHSYAINVSDAIAAGEGVSCHAPGIFPLLFFVTSNLIMSRTEPRMAVDVPGSCL
jgi:hypothetical protein